MINIETPNDYKKNTCVFDNSKNEVLNEVKNSIDDADVIVIRQLNILKENLCKPELNLQAIKQQIDNIASFNKEQNYIYLNNLLRPEKARGCKVPSQIPVPSCSFQLHNSITLTTNDSGNVAFLMNPWFLAGESALGVSLTIGEDNYRVVNYLTSAWVNNSDTLVGNASDSNWEPVNFNQTLPDVYEQYRLVSASLVVKYIGRLDSVSGFIGGAIFYEPIRTVGGEVDPDGDDPVANTTSPDLAKFGNFDYAQDAFFSQQQNTLEGARLLYFPLDNSFEEYTPVLNSTNVDAENALSDDQIVLNPAVSKYGFNWFFYSSGATANSPLFKVDIYCNFECLPSARFLNYMPITLNPFYIAPEEKKRIIMFLHHKAIMKCDEDIFDEVAIPNIFMKMIKKFKNGLPGFDRLRSWGLLNALPGYGPGLALAGNMIQTQMQLDRYC